MMGFGLAWGCGAANAVHKWTQACALHKVSPLEPEFEAEWKEGGPAQRVANERHQQKFDTFIYMNG